MSASRLLLSGSLSRALLLLASLALCGSLAAQTPTTSTTPQSTPRQSVESLSWSELTSASVVISRALVREAERLQQQVTSLQQSLTQLDGSYAALERRFGLLLQSAMSWRREAAALSSSLAAASRSHERSASEQSQTIMQLRTELETARQQRARESRKSRRWMIASGIGLLIGAVGIAAAL